MKINYLLLLFMLSFNLLDAQSTSTNPTIAEAQVPLFVNNNQYESLEGIPYFYDDNFHKGEVTLTQNRHYSKDYKYKFDQLAGSILLQYPNGADTLLDVKDIMTFKMFIGNNTINFVKTTLPHSKEPAMVQVIYWSSKIKFFRDIKKKIIKNREYFSHIDGGIPSKIINDYRYYFSKNDEPLKYIVPSKKGFVKALPEKKIEIESIFKTKKFDDLTVSKLVELMQKLDVNE